MRKALFALALAVLAATASAAHADGLRLPRESCPRGLSSERCTERLRQVFERSYFDDEIYSPLACHANILALVKRLKKEGFRLGDFRVLYLESLMQHEGRYLADGRQFTGVATRDGRVSWIFHVVLETQGHILDLDYLGRAVIVPRSDYFRAMFEETSGQTLGYRSIPAEAYRRGYSDVYSQATGQVRNWAYYLYDVDGLYPARPIER